jgi:hypothetical protein
VELKETNSVPIYELAAVWRFRGPIFGAVEPFPLFRELCRNRIEAEREDVLAFKLGGFHSQIVSLGVAGKESGLKEPVAMPSHAAEPGHLDRVHANNPST